MIQQRVAPAHPPLRFRKTTESRNELVAQPPLRFLRATSCLYRRCHSSSSSTAVAPKPCPLPF
eukprot:4689936-Pyramimonas_sp.AAC.1